MAIGPLRVDMQFGGTWTNITGDVLTTEGVTIRRGRQDESSSSSLEACALNFALKNGATASVPGKWTPANPAGPYYGQLKVGTPVRVGVGTPPNAAFATTIATSTTLAMPNVTTEAPGLLICAAAGGATGVISGMSPMYTTLSGNAANSSCGATTSGAAGSYGSGFSLSTSIGAAVATATIAIPGPASTSAIVQQKQGVSPGNIGSATPSIPISPFTVVAGDVLVVILSWSSDASNAMYGAPVDDQNDAEWELITDSGPSSTIARMQVWVRQCPRGGTINVGAFGHINHAEDLFMQVFQVRGATSWAPRFRGEAASWGTDADLAGTDVRVPFEAGNVVRRRGQGQDPTRSALYRQFALNSAGVVGYWPLETNTSLNLQGNSVLNSVTPGASPAVWAPNASGQIQYGNNSSIAASLSLPTITNGSLTMQVPTYSKTVVGGVFNCEGLVTAVFNLPAAPNAGTALLLISLLGGAAGVPAYMQVSYTNTTTLTMQAYDINKAAVGSAYTVGLANVNSNGTTSFIGNPFAIAVAWTVSNVGVMNFSINSFNMNGNNLAAVPTQGLASLAGPYGSPGSSDGRVATVSTGLDITGTVYSGANGYSIGHVTVSTGGGNFLQGGIYNALGSALPTVGAQGVFVGWAGEDAGSRILRIAQEEEIASGVPVSSVARYAYMGPQYPDTALNLITEAWTTDGGELFEARGYSGFHYRPLAVISGMAAVTTLDFAAKEITNPFTPTLDDTHIRNDVTVSQRNGGQARAYQASGPYSTLPPPSGVGTFTDSVTVNVVRESPVLQRIAEWRVHLGTDGSTRFGTLTSQLAAVPNSAPRISDIDVGQRVSLLNPPVWAPPSPVDLYVVGMAETIGDTITSAWQYTLNVAPFRPLQVFTLGGNPSGEFGLLDFAAATLNAGIASNATSLVITSPYAADFPVSASCPFGVMFAGELMTLTAVGTPSGNTQTWTVVRSVNGVVKAQTAGTAVNVAQPAYLGLN